MTTDGRGRRGGVHVAIRASDGLTGSEDLAARIWQAAALPASDTPEPVLVGVA